ncbi:hypothetical protein AJ79_00229 [Helicocarpus griseus UAMH5409]|uniref:Indole-diterpene biosynthesis protein PaxU n=1 Tax=Helicocarpus griseus UAMH5409 TaxID=1447875 RepID=A0A2B7YBA0_9EURO|nr:hypothetical protein AJ79_00229 [Helicocarpus griseus UAMH5409]
MGSASPPTPDIFTTFTKLSPVTYLREPPPSSSPLTPSQTPTICLLFWMNALPRHTSKFVHEYLTALPHARIICIRTTSADFLLNSSDNSQRRRVAPFVNALLEPNSNEDVPLYFHVFSNGGMFTLYHIAASYRAATGSALPLKTLIVDSAPGRSSMSRTVKAFSYALPKFFLFRMLGQVAIWASLIVYAVLNRLRRRLHPMEVARRRLNDPSYIDRSAKRCYVYSKEDELIDWRHVEEHAREARRAGWEVDMELFEAPHVGSMRADRARYWRVVWGRLMRKAEMGEKEENGVVMN